MLGVKAVHEQIVHDTAPAVGQAGVLDFSIHQFRSIVGGEFLNEGQRTRSADEKFAHVRTVEHADCGANLFMFGIDSLVLHRHFPSGKRHHFRPQGAVDGMKRRFLECNVFGIHRGSFCRFLL